MVEIITIQPRGQDAYVAITRAGNAAYDAAIISGESAFDAYLDTVTTLRAKLNGDDELWLCPACEKLLTPINTLCPCCESEERDAHADREAQTRMRHGR